MSARISQSALLALGLLNGNARVSQSALLALVGLGINCNNPPDGVVGDSYTHAFLAGAGTPPYTFAITAGALPLGLTLDPSTGIASGTLQAAGVYTFTVTVTDLNTTQASVNCSITVTGRGIEIVLYGYAKTKKRNPCPVPDPKLRVPAPPSKRVL